MPTEAPSKPLLLRGGTLLTMDQQASVIHGDLLSVDGRIAALGSGFEVPADCRVIDISDHLVLPGLVQGHIHLGQTLFRGLAEGRRLLPWLSERIWPLEAAHDDESAYASGLLGAVECLLGGTTTVQEIGIGPGIRGLLQAIADSGLRAVAGKCLMDWGEGLPANLREETDATLAHTVELANEFTGADGSRMRYALNPRFILSCSDALWDGIRALSSQHGWPIHTHALEQKEETITVRRLKGGRDEIEYFDECGVLACDFRVAHGVWLSRAHLERVSRERFSVVHCPSSNLKLGSGIADVVGIRRAGVAVGLGADGAPCNNNLDALEEVRLAALLQQVENGPGCFSGVDALRLATSEGARVLGLDDELGSLESGKRADFVVLSLSRPEMWLLGADPHDVVTYAGSRAAIRHVGLAGELVVEDGELRGFDLTDIRDRAERALVSLVARSGIAELAGSSPTPRQH